MTTISSTEQAADVAALLRARNPLIWIQTREEARVEGYLFESAASAGYIARTWDVGQGVADMAGNPVSIGGQDPGEMMAVIGQRARAGNERGVWIMRDLPPWLVGPVGMTTCRQLRNLARLLPTVPRERAQAVIVLTPGGEVPPELANHATVVEWSLPDREEIGRILDAAIAGLPENMKSSAAPNGTRDAAVDAAIGLSGEEAAACYARSLVQLKRIDPPTVSREKKRVIARERVLEWFDPLAGGLDAVGGLDILKGWLVSRRQAYSAAARAYGLPAPRGALLAGVPGCLRGDTRVLLADGRMPTFEQLARQVSDCLEPGEYDVAHRVQLENGKTANASKLQIHQGRETLLIRFRDGREIEATPDHEMMTIYGWVPAGDLVPGDRVLLWDRPTPSAPTPPRRTLFDRPLHSVRRRLVSTTPLPVIWNDSLSEFVGLCLAEGNKDTYRVGITISGDETELAEWVRQRVMAIFGFAPNEFTKKGKNVRGFRLNSFDAAVNLHPLIGGTAREKRIPSVFFELDDDCIGGLLRGLFEGDGTVANGDRSPGARQSPRVEVKTASVAMAHDVQLLLQRLGIPSRISTDKATDCHAVSIGSCEALERFVEKVGFLTERKNSRLENGLASFQRRTSNGFASAAEVVEARWSRQDRVYDLSVPEAERFIANGLLVHNCGKSLTAKAIATAWGVPLLRLDLGALKSKFVGESEGNLRKALRVVEAIGRCVVWLDEIEKALAGATQGAADGGVSSDALGAILSWMQERAGEAFVIATANDVSSLPPELMRKGRFDEIWFVDLPTQTERAEILNAALRAHGRNPKDDLWGYDVGLATEGWTGAEIAALVPDALFNAFADNARELELQDLLDATKSVVPLSKTSAEKITKLRDWATGRARPATTPERNRNIERAAPGRAIDL